MQINGLNIPDESQTVDRIADPIGGHLYTVVTTVNVKISRLDEVQTEIATLQAEIDEKTAALATLQASVATLPALADATLDAPAKI